MSNCIFCDIVKGIIPANVICENEHAIAFMDVNPISDGHVLIISKKHYPNFSKCDSEVLAAMTKMAQEVAKIIEDSSLRPWGFNYLSNEGSVAGQEVMHFHIHVIPKYAKNEGFGIKSDNIRIKHDVNKVYDLIMKEALKNCNKTLKIPLHNKPYVIPLKKGKGK